jgi:hypothetical protein
MELTPTPYEPPTIEVVGTLQEITKGGGFENSDNGTQPNNAFPNPITS